MKALIVGAGAVGVAIGASIKNNGFRVDFLARKATAEYIKSHGIERTGIFGNISLGPDEIGVYESYDELPGGYDYVIVSAKTMANEEIARELNRIAKDLFLTSGKIVLFQNGWGNAEPYLKYFDKSMVYNARVITGFEKNTPGSSRVTVHTAPILLGSLFGCDKSVMEPLVKAINDSDIPSESTDTVAEALWAKMLFNTTLNPLGAILNVSYGELSESEHAKGIMNKLIDETYEVILACGFKTFWSSADEYREIFYKKLVPDTYKHRSSTLQDIEKGQKTEIDTLNGCIISLAAKKGIDVPTHTMIYELIKAIEEKKR